MSVVGFRERVVHAGTASNENGFITIRDERGIIRWSNSPSDRPDARDRGDFNVNSNRLHNLEKVIAARYGGPCDCDGDAHAYLSVGLNAVALDCRMRRWKPHVGPLLKWAAEWIPVADPEEMLALAEKVISNPRRITASTAGKLIRLTAQEWQSLAIKYIDPCDLTDDAIEEIKRRKRSAARSKDRRANGARSAAEVIENSLRSYCDRHGLSERSLRAARARGPDALAKFLSKRNVVEKLPLDGPTIVTEPILMLGQGAASFAKPAAGKRPKAASSPIAWGRYDGFREIAAAPRVVAAIWTFVARQNEMSDHVGRAIVAALSGATTRADGPLRALRSRGSTTP